MKMRLNISTLVASLLLTKYVKARWKPTQGMTWNYVLESKVNLNSEKAQVLNIDYEEDKSVIQKYHNAGKKVICYFSGGTIEDFRDDYSKFKAVNGLIKNNYSEWSGENWLDIRKEGLRSLIKNRMKIAVNKKCDALEVDNLDGWQNSDIKNNWANPLTLQDTINYAKWLGTTAHELNISIGLKNALFMIDEVGSYFDFAINESCATLKNPECHLYSNFLKQGKAVFGISYQSEMRNQSASSLLCKNLNGLNISMIIKKNRKLVQDGSIFDSKKECGTSNTPKKTTTTSKKTTTTPKKTTTTSKKTTTTPKKTTTTTKKTTTTTKKTTTRKTTTTKKNTTTTRKTTTKKNTTTTRKTTTKKNTTTATKKTKKVVIKIVKVKKNN